MMISSEKLRKIFLSSTSSSMHIISSYLGMNPRLYKESQFVTMGAMAWSMNMHISMRYITVFWMLVDLQNETELEIFRF
jgi:hypothetical protein